MMRRSHLFLFALALSATTACAADDDEIVVDESDKSDVVNVPSPGDFPGVDNHCRRAFPGRCNKNVAFSSSRAGAIGIKVDAAAHSGSGYTVRAFIESADLDDLRTRLYFSPDRVGSLAEAEQLGGIRAQGTRTGFGGHGMELRLSGEAQAHMMSAGHLDGFFYLEVSGGNGTIRAIDFDL